MLILRRVAARELHPMEPTIARPAAAQDTTMADDLENTIRQNAEGPAKVAGDAGSVEQHSLSDQIEADRYLASKQAAKTKRRGLRFNKLIPPGAD